MEVLQMMVIKWMAALSAIRMCHPFHHVEIFSSSRIVRMVTWSFWSRYDDFVKLPPPRKPRSSLLHPISWRPRSRPGGIVRIRIFDCKQEGRRTGEMTVGTEICTTDGLAGYETLYSSQMRFRVHYVVSGAYNCCFSSHQPQAIIGYLVSVDMLS